MSSHADKEFIRDFYTDTKNNPAANCGLHTYQQELKSRDIIVSIGQLQKILSEIPDYLQNASRVKKFKRRQYNVHGWFSLLECDLADMSKNSDGFRYIFVCIDVYTLYAFTNALRLKKGENVVKCFKDIIQKFGKPDQCQFDLGGEFQVIK